MLVTPLVLAAVTLGYLARNRPSERDERLSGCIRDCEVWHNGNSASVYANDPGEMTPWDRSLLLHAAKRVAKRQSRTD